MKKKLLVTLLLFVACSFLIAERAFAGEPTDVVSAQVDKILKVLVDPALQGEAANAEKRNQVIEISNGVFDYHELSQRTLGRNWRDLDAKQQEEFVSLFRDLLSKVYVDRIMEYSDEKITFDKETMASADKAEVRSSIVTATKTIPMDYRMFLNNGQWKVYDVIIEGVSLIKNYRTQFKDILAKGSPEKLLELLREKTAKS